MEGKTLKCSNHDSDLIGLCLEKDCPSYSVCAKCLISTHRNYQNKVIFFEDILNEDLPSIFKQDALSSTIPSQNLKNALNASTQNYYSTKVSALYSSFLSDLTAIVSESESKICESLKEPKPIDDLATDLKNILCLDELKEILVVSTEDSIEERLAEVSLIQKRREIIDSLREYAHNNESTLKFATKLSILEQKLNQLLKSVSNELSKPIVVTMSLKFDPSNTGDYLQLSEDLKTVRQTSQNDVTHASFLNLEMPANTGVYKWKIKVSGVENVYDYESYWIGLGIVGESEWNETKTEFPYGKTISACTDNANYGNMQIMENNLNSTYEGKIFELTYDSDNCLLTAEIENGYRAVAKTISNVKYKPLIMTYRIGNTCTIIQ